MTVGLPVLTSWLSGIAGLRMTLGALLLASVLPPLLPAGSPPTVLALAALGALWLSGGWLLALQRVGWALGRRLVRPHMGRAWSAAMDTADALTAPAPTRTATTAAARPSTDWATCPSARAPAPAAHRASTRRRR